MERRFPGRSVLFYIVVQFTDNVHTPNIVKISFKKTTIIIYKLGKCLTKLKLSKENAY